jgi:threonine/homoserine/homoserine lactone efflux protein
MELVGIFLTSLGIGFTGAVMPGPLLAVTLKESLSRSKWSSVWLSSGHALCELVMVGVLATGLSKLVSGDAIVGPVGLVGGAILIWMGIGALKQPPYQQDAIQDQGSNVRAARHTLVLRGSAVTVSNPYWTIWWLTAGLTLVLVAAKAGPAGIVAFYFGHILSDFLWFGSVGVLIGSGKRFFTGGVYKLIIQTCGIFLLFFGISFIGYGGKMIHSVWIH